jgi:thiamine biosynthesis lipoprotein ApbE
MEPRSKRPIGALRPGLLLSLAAALAGSVPLALAAGNPGTHEPADIEPSAISESTRVLMGVQATIRIIRPDDRTEGEAERAMRVVWDRLDALEWVMSDYRSESELSRLNAAAGTGPRAISPDMQAVLARSLAIAEETDGTFDPTVGPLVDQWRASRRSGTLAPSDERQAARARVGHRWLELDPAAGTAALVRPGMRLDLGGIGKGWAAAEAVRMLREAGFPRCLVSIAGDVAAGDPPPGRRGWRMLAGRDGEAAPARLELAGAAVSTSGDSSQFVTIAGRRYAHIVDPRTGLGATVRRAVTVLAPDAADADALASAFHLLGPEAAAPIVAARPGTAARFHAPSSDAGEPARTVIIDPHGAWAQASRGTANRPPAASPAVRPDRVLGVPVVDLDRPEHAHRFVVVDREPGQYLGHPTSVLLEDGRTILCVYPQGHGRGPIILKRSGDGGRTWSDRLPVPENWATSQETPTIHRVTEPDGHRRLILFSGLNPIRVAASEDDGATWTPLAPVGDWGGIVAMSAVEPVRRPDGGSRLMALFHDDGRFIAPGGRRATGTFTLYRTWSEDAGRTWSAPEAIWTGGERHYCEPGLIRSPDGGTIAILLRENRRRDTSAVMLSRDEGVSWSEPRRLPLALTGDRHQGRYAPDGRLVISFRDMAMGSPTYGDWVAWVGRFENLTGEAAESGSYRVRLQDNLGGTDCAYPAVERLPDGTFVLTTYGHWAPGEPPFILSVRFTVEELDAARDAGHRVRGDEPGLPGGTAGG